jgi:hypothetical protein
MPILQTLRNDEVQGMADRLGGGMTENAFGAGVPKTNDTVAVCRDDRFGTRAQQRFCNQA